MSNKNIIEMTASVKHIEKLKSRILSKTSQAFERGQLGL